jgi:hypothetical protein
MLKIIKNSRNFRKNYRILKNNLKLKTLVSQTQSQTTAWTKSYLKHPQNLLKHTSISKKKHTKKSQLEFFIFLLFIFPSFYSFPFPRHQVTRSTRYLKKQRRIQQQGGWGGRSKNMEMRSDGYAQDWLKLKWMSKYEKYEKIFYFVLDMKWNTAAAALPSCSFLLLLFKSIKMFFFYLEFF